MKTLRVATSATLFLAFTLPLLHVSASADVPPPGPPGLIDPDLLPEGDDFPSPFELGARLVGKSPECAEKCRHLIFEYGKALKRFEEAEDALDADEGRRRSLKDDLAATPYGEKPPGADALTRELRTIEARLPEREKAALDAERAAVRALRRFEECIDACPPPADPGDGPSSGEGEDTVLQVLDHGRPVPVQVFFLHEQRSADPSAPLSREALETIPLPSRSIENLPRPGLAWVDLGRTDATGAVRVPPLADFGRPGTTAVAEVCDGQRKVFILAPQLTLPANHEGCGEAIAAAFHRDPLRVEIKERQGFFHTPKVWAIPAAAAGVIVATQVGGSQSSTPTAPASVPSTTAPPPSTPPSVPASPQGGTYVLAWTTLEDLRQSAQFVRLQTVEEARIEISGSTVTMTAPSLLPNLMGPLTPNGRIMLTGAGLLAGRPMVGVTLVGTLTAPGVASALSAAGELNATVTVGEDGSLGPPLPHVVRYGLVGTRRP